MTTLRVNVHGAMGVGEDADDPGGDPVLFPLDGPFQLVWNSQCPEEIVIAFGDGEFSLARSQFFTYDDFPEGSVAAVMNITEDRMLFKVPSDEAGKSFLYLSEHGADIRTWVFNTHAQEAAHPAAHDFDAELARLLEGTL